MSVMKFANRRKTQKIVAPIHAETQLNADQVIDLVRRLVQEDADRAASKYQTDGNSRLRRVWNGSMARMHMELTENSDGLHVTYPAVGSRDWHAVIEVAEDSTCTHVSSRVLQWMEKDGEMNGKFAYLRFLEDLAQAL